MCTQGNQCSINGFKIQHPFRNKFSAKHRIKKGLPKHDIKVTHTKSVINITLNDEKLNTFA